MTTLPIAAFVAILISCPALAADAPIGDSVMGNWDGEWKNDDGHGGKLTAQVIAEGDDNYKAIFTAYYGPISVFKVSLKGKREKDAVKFGGKVDLGAAFGGEFDWNGGVAGEKFDGRYTSAKDIGNFTMKKIRKTSPTLGAKPPAGAIVLFDGTNLDAWQTADRKPAAWRIVDGVMEVTKGSIYTKSAFGDVQLHAEFMTPFLSTARGQARGNSGIYVNRTLESTARDWEIQILDSFGLDPKDNECGAVYGVRAPSGNASFPPGDWQTFDITFTARRYGDSGELAENARIMVVHNGTKVIDNLKLVEKAPGTGYLMLQDHGNPVRFRNIWLVPSSPAAK